MGLTTILTTIWRLSTEIRPCAKTLFLTAIGHVGTFLHTLSMSGVKGSRVQAGETWDSLSLWKYAI
jgi:hypothetical protein